MRGKLFLLGAVSMMNLGFCETGHQGSDSGPMFYTSGQYPVNGSGQMLQGDIQVLASQVFKNMGQVLKGSGYKFSDVLKVVVYLTDIRDYEGMVTVFNTVFGANPPALDVAAVPALPGNAKMEASAIASH